MKFLIPLFVFGLALVSCNNSSESKNIDTSNLDQVELHIEGMSCEKMCGGAIQSGLEKLDGVATTDLNFNSENTVDVVTVFFDSEKISSEKMVEKVESLAGGAYQVKDSKEL